MILPVFVAFFSFLTLLQKKKYQSSYEKTGKFVKLFLLSTNIAWRNQQAITTPAYIFLTRRHYLFISFFHSFFLSFNSVFRSVQWIVLLFFLFQSLSFKSFETCLDFSAVSCLSCWINRYKTIDQLIKNFEKSQI